MGRLPVRSVATSESCFRTYKVVQILLSYSYLVSLVHNDFPEGKAGHGMANMCSLAQLNDTSSHIHEITAQAYTQ